MKALIAMRLRESADMLLRIVSDAGLMAEIEQVAKRAIAAYKAGNKILLAGNGGSAADAQHIAGEFVNRFLFDRPALPALALSTDTSVLTAIGNDSGFERVFERQVEANGFAGDVFFGFTTSGRSSNILRAMAACRNRGIVTVAFTGAAGLGSPEECDHCIRVPAKETPRIQEAHCVIGHVLCELIEAALFKRQP